MTGAILALDVGARRVGVARASLHARLPQALITLENNSRLVAELARLCEAEQAVALIVGLPRGLDGQHTVQTQAVEAFVAELGRHLSVPIHWQDEAVTSVQAEKELQARGKPYTKGDIDALAAIYILEDYLRDHPQGETG